MKIGHVGVVGEVVTVCLGMTGKVEARWWCEDDKINSFLCRFAATP